MGEKIKSRKIEVRENHGMTIVGRAAKKESLPAEVIVLSNLYGDIVTDVAAEQQGGLGKASSSNIGNLYALFEAIHGVGFLLMKNRLGHYATLCSLIRAMGEMLAHIGYADRKKFLGRDKPPPRRPESVWPPGPSRG